MSKTLKLKKRKYEWELSRVRNVVCLIMTPAAATLVKDALEIINPDTLNVEEVARSMAGMIENVL